MGKQVGFTRWYDRSPQVSQAVRTLEKADPNFQRAIAEIVNEMTDSKNLNTRSEGGLKKVGSQKIMGLMKSKAKRRWYDENPEMHRAINHMYIMDDVQREEVALKIIVALSAMTAYQRKCLNAEDLPDFREMLSITKSVFQKDPESLLGLTVRKTGNEEDPAPVFAKPRDIVDSEGGLKISMNRASNTML